MNKADLIIVGNAGGTNVGASLYRAAERSGVTARFCDAMVAQSGPKFMRRLSWRLCGHRPTFMKRFSADVVEACRESSPRAVLTTGLAPVDADGLREIGRMGIRRLNYLTDDPWNPTQGSRWFFRSLSLYDAVFSPRQANLNDLRQHGCKAVHYLPFAYDDELFFCDYQTAGRGQAFDAIFAGGADVDRLPFIKALLEVGAKLALIGDYWDRFAETRNCTLGHLDAARLREVTAASKTAVCLVRRANRDGHVMRSFEIPAIGTCMMAEDTIEHRTLFGEGGSMVAYFKSPREMTERAEWLLAHSSERERLAKAAHQRITMGRNTYKDRLETMWDAL